VALGIKEGVEPKEVRKAIEDSTLEGLLAWLPVDKRDMIFVDAGTVHAIGPGVVFLETQQNSDLTYRMYDYGRPRELHVDLSMEAMRLQTRAGRVKPLTDEDHSVLIDVPYFRIDRFTLGISNGAKVLGSANDPFGDRAQIFFVSDGAVSLHSSGADSIHLGRCQTAIVPASAGDWTLKPEGVAEVVRIVPQPGKRSN
jgi:mannose-6-phosphate isomerase